MGTEISLLRKRDASVQRRGVMRNKDYSLKKSRRQSGSGAALDPPQSVSRIIDRQSSENQDQTGLKGGILFRTIEPKETDLTDNPGPSVTIHARDKSAHNPSWVDKSLSRRELEVAWLAAAGWRNKEIADRLFISPFTVRDHLSATYKKLGVTNRTMLWTSLPLIKRG